MDSERWLDLAVNVSEGKLQEARRRRVLDKLQTENAKGIMKQVGWLSDREKELVLSVLPSLTSVADGSAPSFETANIHREERAAAQSKLRAAWKIEDGSIGEVPELPPELFLKLDKYLDPIDLLAMSHVNSDRRREIQTTSTLNKRQQSAVKVQATWRDLLDPPSTGVAEGIFGFFQNLLLKDQSDAEGSDDRSASERLVARDDLELLKTVALRSDHLTAQQQSDLHEAIKTLAAKSFGVSSRSQTFVRDICLETFASHFEALSPELRAELEGEADKMPYLPSGMKFLAYGLPTFSTDRHEELVTRIEDMTAEKDKFLATKSFAVGLGALSVEHRQRLLKVALALPPIMRAMALEPFIQRIDTSASEDQRRTLIDLAKKDPKIAAYFGDVLAVLSEDEREEMVRSFQGFAAGGSNGRLLSRFASGASCLSPDLRELLFNEHLKFPEGEERQYVLAGFAPALSVLSKEKQRTVIERGIIPLIATQPQLLVGLRTGIMGLEDKLDDRLRDRLVKAIKSIADPERRAKALLALGQGLAPYAPMLYASLVMLAREIDDPKLRKRTEVALSLS